jgi:hypothetical protein
MIASEIMPALRLLHLVPYQLARVAAPRLRLARVRDSGHPPAVLAYSQIGVNSRDDMAQRSTEAVDCLQKLVTKGGVNNAIVATTLTRLKFSPGCQAANSAQQT